MPPVLRELKARNTKQIKTWCSLNEEMRERSEPEVEPEAFSESLDSKKASKRLKYQKASFYLRAKLIQMVDNEGLSIRQASKRLEMKYSTAKCIYKLFQEEARLGSTRISKEALLNAKIEYSEDEKESVDTSPSTATKKVKKDYDENSDQEITVMEEKPELKKAYQQSFEPQQKSDTSLNQKPVQDNFQAERCQVKIPIPLNYSKKPTKPHPYAYVLNGFVQCFISNGMVVLIPGEPQRHQNTESKTSFCNPILNVSQLPSRAGFLNYQQAPLMMTMNQNAIRSCQEFGFENCSGLSVGKTN